MNRKDRRAGRKGPGGASRLSSASPHAAGTQALSASASRLFQEALGLASSGRARDAWDRCQKILQENPRHPEALHLGGIVSLQMGEGGRAVELLTSAVTLKPQNPEAHSALGNAFQATGDNRAATAAYRRAIDIRPDFAEARVNLGNVLQVAGDNDAAIREYEQAIRLRPDLADAHYNLGVLFKARGKPGEALACYERAVAAAPRHAAAHNNCGVVLKELGRLEAALAAFRTALAIVPNFPECLDNLGATLVLLGRNAEAADSFRRAIAARPGFAEAHHHLALALMTEGAAEEAMKSFRRVVEIKPDFADAHSALARIFESMNRLADANESARKALATAPRDRQANLVAARLERREDRLDAAAARLLPFSQTAEADELGVEIRFDLGQINDRLGRTADAFQQFTEGNRLALRVYGDFKDENTAYLRQIDTLAEAYTPSWTGTWTPIQPTPGRPAPVFLIGFPRSGTTLLDQILDSHPKLQTLEERPAVYTMATMVERFPGGYPGALAGLSPTQLESVRDAYFETVGRFLNRRSDGIVIDKLPLATIHAGLIHRIFPDAKFIMALRHPCDVCLSCFMQSFKLNPAMASFVTLEGAAALYAKVMRLWGIYRRVLPLASHIVRYEDLVSSPESEARRLLDFIGVEWNDAVLRHSEHARERGRINTPSYHQVAEPIYQRASGRWRRYQAELAPIMNTLEPFIEEFGYADA